MTVYGYRGEGEKEEGAPGKKAPGQWGKTREGNPVWALEPVPHSDFCRYQEAERMKKGKSKRE